jgi:VWFA-related protein
VVADCGSSSDNQGKAKHLSFAIRHVAFVLLTSATLLAQSQDPPPQFRTGVELIQLDVVVLDGKRQPVSGLTETDFTVLDEGKPTPIRAFTPVQLATRTRATEAVWASDVPPDVVTNQVSTQEGRLLVILLDRTIPVQESVTMAKKIARAAVESMGPGDLGAVVSTAHNAVQDASVQNLTSDRTRLLRAIDAANPAIGISPAAEAVMGKLDPRIDGQCLCGTCVPETITRVAEAVRDLPRRRKVLFFIGSDVIWQVPPEELRRRPMLAPTPPACQIPLKDARTAMLAAVDRANLTVHSIDPSSLNNVGAQAQAGISGRGFDGIGGSLYGPNQRVNAQSQLQSDTLAKRENLAMLPDRTGGRIVIGRNNPEQTVPEIIRETDAYYVLGIERAASTRPDGTRSIEVKVGRKGLHVYAQRQYGPPPTPPALTVTSGATASAATADALTSPLPNGGVPLSLAVVPFDNPEGSKPIVRVSVDAAGFARTDGNGVSLEVSVVAVDRTGKGVASARQMSWLTPSAAGTPAPREVNVLSQLELDPGDYGVRVAVFDGARNKVASVFADTTVPRFEEAPLSMSGVNVEAVGEASKTPMSTTRRTFARTEQVRAVMQIYQGTRRTDPIVPVSMRVQILDAKGSAIRDQSLPFAETAFTNRRADCVITLPLTKLPAGEYLLKLEASSSRATSGRALRFAVQ